MNPIESTKTPPMRSHLAKVGAMMILSFAACGPTIVETHGVNLAAPTVLSNTPLNGAADTAIDTSISVTFDQEMDADTVSDATFTVTSGDPAINVSGTVSYGNAKAAFLPTFPLLNNTTYTASISTAVESALGITLATRHVWSFTTIGTAPAVLASTPVDLAARVAIDATVSVLFSEPMDANTLTSAAFTLTAGNPAVAISGTLSYNNATAVFTPALPLANNTAFTATLNTLAESALGVPLAANRVWTFITIGTTPTVLATFPLDGATRVAVNGSISVTFSEAMDVSTLAQAAFSVTAGNPSVVVPGIFGYANSVAVFTPVPALANNTLVTVTVTTGAESALNVALAEDAVWSFTTIGTTPTVLPGTPLNGATRVAILSGASFTFSEAMDVNTLTATTFTLTSGNPAVTVAGSIAYANGTATFTPTAPLDNNTDYTATINTGVQSALGVALTADEVWSFTTIASTPTVSNTPLSLATGVAINAEIVLTFSEAMDENTFTGATFTLTSGNPTVAVTGSFIFAGLTATFTPAAPLKNNTAYTATLTTGIESALGIPLAANHSWMFVTIDYVPTVTTIFPTNFATRVAIGDAVSATFSAVMDAGSLTIATFTLAAAATPTVLLPGTVSYANATATFTPDAPLANGTPYTATINTGVMSSSGIPLTADRVWGFTTIHTTPTVLSELPAPLAANVAINSDISVTFSEAMDAGTLNPGTFTLSDGAGLVMGTVSYAGSIAVFTPAAPLVNSTFYTVTVSAGAESANNVALATGHTFSFETIGITPSIDFTDPADNVTIDRGDDISATFNEAMNGATINQSTFTLTSGNPVIAVAGTVNYTNLIATFVPNERLTAGTEYTATLNTGAMSANDVPLPSDYAWSFTTAPGATLVDLGTAGDFVVLAQTAVTAVTTTTRVVGDIGISPAFSSAITGFSLLITDATEAYFLTSTLVTGKVFAADNSAPTPVTVATAVNDMAVAITDAAGRTPDFTDTGASGDIGGMTLVAGVYKWTDSLAMTTNVTLDGNAADVWIFQIAQDVTMSSNVSVVLIGGALPANVFWQVGGQVELGTLAHFKGIVLSQSAITLYTGATVKGRLLSQTSVTLHGDTFVNAGSSGLGVNLGTAHDFAILAKTAISNVPDAAKYVTGNIGVSPIDSTAITGFNCVLDTLTGDYALSSLVIGKCFASDYTGTGLPTTPAKMTTAISDMEAAFVDAAGRAPDATELYAGNIGGRTLAAGVYKWSSGLLIPTDVYLTGSATDVWIFQVAQDLTMASATNIHLAGGALPENIFWQVSGQVVIDTDSHFEGIVLSQTAITLRNGASINGRLLAQTAVILDSNTVTQPND